MKISYPTDSLSYLRETTQALLAGCRVRADDGTMLYTPDGRGNYRAIWTRDFTYMVQSAGNLIPPEDIEAAIRFLIKGQRADGWVPDRVRPDGLPVYVAGPEDQPLGLENLDNNPFLVILVDEYLKMAPPARRAGLLAEWQPAINRALRALPLGASGLVFNDPAKPHSPYGFTDNVCKTGELFMESLLYWDALKRTDRLRVFADTAELQRRISRIEAAMDIFWDPGQGAFLAATKDCRQVDIWGSLYALYAGFPLGEKRPALLDFIVQRLGDFCLHGQVRHLLAGEHWHRLLVNVEPGTYQNGAYWATASGWLIWSLAQVRPNLAEQVLADLVQNFQVHGIFECINQGYQKLDTYVVSAANPYGALHRLEREE
jgi:hypothetical protein